MFTALTDTDFQLLLTSDPVVRGLQRAATTFRDARAVPLALVNERGDLRFVLLNATELYPARYGVICCRTGKPTWT